MQLYFQSKYGRQFFIVIILQYSPIVWSFPTVGKRLGHFVTIVCKCDFDVRNMYLLMKRLDSHIYG